MADTKDRIMEAALELFSEKGYDAVSVGEIAAAVGIKPPSLYKHFASKQDLFEALRIWIQNQYNQATVLALSGQKDRLKDYEAISKLTPEEFSETICRQLSFLTHHPVISKIRKLFTIEQFRNPLLADLLEKNQYEHVLDYHRGLIEYLVYRGILQGNDYEVMALQFLSPITVELQRLDRNPECETEAKELIKKHIIQFFKIYGNKS